MFKALEIVAEKYHLPYLEAKFDGTPTRFADRQVIILPMGSMSADYDPAEHLKKTVLENASEDMPNVAVLHTGYIDNYLLKNSSLTINRVRETEMICDPAIKAWLDENDVELITFDEAR